MQKLSSRRKFILKGTPRPFAEYRGDWTIAEHTGWREQPFDPSRLFSFVCKLQHRGEHEICGEYILKRLRRWQVPVIDARMHSFYVANPHRVPKWMRQFVVYSWGTIFRDGNGKGHHFVKCFYFVGGRVRESYKMVESWEWRSNDIAGMILGLPSLKP